MNMTDEQMRIAIAEACGWSEIDRYIGQEKMPEGLLKGQNPKYKGGKKEELPDYLNDLNACAEFEKTLNAAEQDAYWCQIVNLCNEAAREQKKFELVGIFYQITATARQRCIACLKTKGMIP